MIPEIISDIILVIYKINIILFIYEVNFEEKKKKEYKIHPCKHNCFLNYKRKKKRI